MELFSVGIGSISSNSLYINTQVSENSVSRPEGFQGTGKDVFVRDESAQFAKEQEFAKAGRLFQSCGREAQQTNSASSLISVQGEPVSMFEGRNGYDKSFLGVELPLPGLGSSIQNKVAMRTDKPGECELTYTNYSVVMNKERKQCFYAICNIDGRASRSVKREGTWTLDGRIPRKYQLGDENVVAK